MNSRRKFIRQSSLAGFALTFGKFDGIDLFSSANNKGFVYESKFIRLALSPERPQFTYFSTDSLGQSQFEVNPLLENANKSIVRYVSKIKGNSIAWYSHSGENTLPVWEAEGRGKEIIFKTHWKKEREAEPFNIVFSQLLNHCTVLGTMKARKEMQFPCLLHFPGMGSFRVYCSDPAVTMFYDACRNLKNSISPDPKGEYEGKYVKIALPAADARHPDITYTFESVAIYPDLEFIKNDPRFDGFKRDFINIFQLNPRIMALANNSAATACAFVLYLYSDVAKYTPELMKGFTAMDLIRNTLNRYLGGMKGYGQVGFAESFGWASKFTSSDSMPSLVISACDYILQTKDNKWAEQNYAGIKGWADEMIATDKDKDGIIEYGVSGNANTWHAREEADFTRPANWWDTIGFGHDDAYSNALAYRSCLLLSEVAARLNKIPDSKYYASFATKLKSNYYNRFYNPATGLLAGWKSSDGKLHDYYFTFVNSIAICYGLIDESQAKRIMKILLSKMKEVGYTDFRLGLPGNLIPIRSEDYTDKNHRYGYGAKEDGSDGFQIYENGGASGCYAYFTIHALFKTGMIEEAKAILFSMLESYKKGDFSGFCHGSEMSRDWKTWSGECWGYEGFLVDNYHTFLSVFDLK
jgi:hypothetical protein